MVFFGRAGVVEFSYWGVGLAFKKFILALDNSLQQLWKSILIKKVAISLFCLRNHVDSLAM